VVVWSQRNVVTPGLIAFFTSMRPQPSEVLGMLAVPMSIAVLTINALIKAGLGVAPLLLSRHHSVIKAAPPDTCGAAMLVPEHTECVLEFGALRYPQLVVLYRDDTMY